MSMPQGIRGALSLAALALVVTTAPLAAQQAITTGTFQAMLSDDLEQLEEKYVGLLQAMPDDSLDWRPAEGVRSVREVFGHVAGANYMIATFVGGEVPADVRSRYASAQAYEGIQDKQELLQLVRNSFAHARMVVAAIPDARLGESVTMFGQPSDMRRAAFLLVTHNHEHLGQAIAYARSLGVTPPWSGGGD